ncbi:MAG: hypothetical protein ACUVR3_10525 [Candidatus Roseilinea sp.]
MLSAGFILVSVPATLRAQCSFTRRKSTRSDAGKTNMTSIPSSPHRR